ncbi:MAG TPA: 50S ribosomal protein L32 [Caldithrix abyssi]|uniref:Large ribosomal subunit protein bL32 n=1 Tax=Caldithrix abyssi TaxID=187145 RepID=A0A7V1PUU8_CALAY|nr:50S ribosomal protein L32 [Caldithrix abyssi]
MANPKRKISKSKRDHRRAHWMGGLSASNLAECPNCGESMMSHHVCPSCGYYKGDKAIKVDNA